MESHHFQQTKIPIHRTSLTYFSPTLQSRATSPEKMPTTRLLAASAAATRRCSTNITAEQMFIEAWKKVVPNIDPPQLPLSFMQHRPQVWSSIPTKLTLNFHFPYSSEISNEEVDMLTVPATTGQMGILPGHVATMTELKPGLLSLHKGNETTKYFISCGFALIHPNSITDIIAVEAVPVDKIDPHLAQKGLAEFSQKLSSATTDSETAEAQIGVDVHNALLSALTS